MCAAATVRLHNLCVCAEFEPTSDDAGIALSDDSLLCLIDVYFTSAMIPFIISNDAHESSTNRT